MKYEWKNTVTGEVVEHEHWSMPPDVHMVEGVGKGESGNWERLYTFSLGRVEGGGGSPSRRAARRKS